MADPRRALPEPADHRDGQHDPQRRDPVADPRPRRQQQPDPVDHRLLRPGLRRPAADHRQPRRDRFGRKGALQIGIVLFGIGSVLAAMSETADAADLHPGVHGHRRRADHAVDAVDPHQRLPRPEGAGPGDRRLGRLLRARRRHRPDDRRLPARALLVAARCSGSTCRSASPRWSLGAFLVPTSRDPRHGQARPDRRRAVDRRSRRRCCSASSRARSRAGPTAEVVAAFVVAVIALGGFVALGAPRPRRRCSTSRCFHNPRFTRRQRDDHADRSSPCSARCS